MTNNTTLREDLIAVYNELRSGDIGISEAKELANVSGKVLSSAKSQLEYQKYAGKKEAIKFFEE